MNFTDFNEEQAKPVPPAPARPNESFTFNQKVAPEPPKSKAKAEPMIAFTAGRITYIAAAMVGALVVAGVVWKLTPAPKPAKLEAVKPAAVVAPQKPAEPVAEAPAPVAPAPVQEAPQTPDATAQAAPAASVQPAQVQAEPVAPAPVATPAPVPKPAPVAKPKAQDYSGTPPFVTDKTPPPIPAEARRGLDRSARPAPAPQRVEPAQDRAARAAAEKARLNKELDDLLN